MEGYELAKANLKSLDSLDRNSDKGQHYMRFIVLVVMVLLMERKISDERISWCS
jgi:hypothetical protein